MPRHHTVTSGLTTTSAPDPAERRDLSANEDQAERLHSLRASALGWWQESGGAALEIPAESAR